MIDVQFSSFEIFRDSPGESMSTRLDESELSELASAETVGYATCLDSVQALTDFISLDGFPQHRQGKNSPTLDALTWLGCVSTKSSKIYSQGLAHRQSDSASSYPASARVSSTDGGGFACSRTASNPPPTATSSTTNTSPPSSTSCAPRGLRAEADPATAALADWSGAGEKSCAELIAVQFG